MHLCHPEYMPAGRSHAHALLANNPPLHLASFRRPRLAARSWPRMTRGAGTDTPRASGEPGTRALRDARAVYLSASHHDEAMVPIEKTEP